MPAQHFERRKTMTYVIFENYGEIDKRAMTVLGASVKGDSAIGYFGTGLKFSIACLLRNGCEISVYSGAEKLKFDSVPQKIRGKDFSIVCMNGQELSYTTQLGRDWKLWQAFRELHSNCLDEGGKTYISETIPDAETGKTVIAVRGDDFVDEYNNMDKIFISKDDYPLEKNDKCEVFEGSGVFYRGVRVKENVDALRRYNILHSIDLTEDRTAKYDFQVNRIVAYSVSQSNDRQYIEAVCTADYSDCMEGKVDLSEVSDKPSVAYMETVKWLIENKPVDLNGDAKKLYEKFSPKIEPNVLTLNQIEQAQLDKALTLCDKLGFPARKYPISVYETLGNGCLAAAHEHSGGRYIMLSKEIFSKGVMTLTRGLIEEYIHLHYGYDDYCLEMQNFIFDKMVHYGMQSIGEVA